MWKCQNCGKLQRISYRCKYCSYKFPEGLTGAKLREMHKKVDIDGR